MDGAARNFAWQMLSQMRHQGGGIACVEREIYYHHLDHNVALSSFHLSLSVKNP